jgi:hypothetical protein
VVAAALGLAAVLGAGEVLDEPDTVDLVVRNESTRAVTVHVRGATDGPLLPVATVDAGEERSVEQVIDQGARWLVTFRVAGRDVGTAELAGTELEADGYRLAVPASVDDAAGAEGIDPTP